MTPGTQVLNGVGATGQLTATVARSDGPVASPVVTWVSLNTTIATVAGTGATATVTAVSAGAATITATSGGVSGSATVTVSQPPAAVASVVVTAPLTNLDEGATGQLTATVRDAANNVLTGRVVTWASSNQATATVSTAGQVGGVAEGDTVIVTATSEGVSGTAKVVVRSLYFIAKEVAVGSQHACAVRIIGGTYCWGRRGEGQLGNPLNPGAGPRMITGGPSVFTQVTAGTFHSCGLTSAGAAYCFGLNNSRELGAGSTSTFETLPVAVSGGLVFAKLFAGPPSVCGLTANGTAYCWGRNQPEELGVGTATSPVTAPTAVVGDHRFRTLARGGAHSCGIDTDGALWCWGNNSQRQLGIGSTSPVQVTVPTIVNPPAKFTAIAAGASHTCAIDSSGLVWCWGDNAQVGALGDGTIQDRSTPVRIASNLTFTQITAGDRSTCAIATSGDVWCWGMNDSGQLGNGTTANTVVPVKADVAVGFTSIATNFRTVCAIAVNRRLHCWGNNGGGEAGSATPFLILKPTAVLRP